MISGKRGGQAGPDLCGSILIQKNNKPATMRPFFHTILFFLTVIISTNAQTAGTLDPGFGAAGKTTTSIGPFNAYAHAVAVQADGKVLVAGESLTGNAVLEDFALARYHTNGTLDASFGTNGLVVTDLQQATDVIKAIAVQPDGKILVAGYSDNTFNYDFAVARYNANGTLDPSFGTNGIVVKNFGSTDFGLAMALLPSGKILVAGRAYNGINSDFALIQLNANGTFDNSFGVNGAVTSDLFGETESGNAIAVQSNGKIVVVGDRYDNNVSTVAAARFNPDGSLDTGFNFDGKFSLPIGQLSDVAYAVALQTDGKIVLAGSSNTTNVSDVFLVRLLADGTLDASFDGDGVVVNNVANGGDYAYAVAVQPNGKILVGATATGSNSVSDFVLLGYQPNGSLDASFGNGGITVTDFNTGRDVVTAIALHQGKVLLAGYSDKNGQSAFAVARYQGSSSVGIPDINQELLQLAPNPAAQTVRLSLPSAAAGQLRIFSATGCLMLDMAITTRETLIAVSDWPEGLYVVQYGENGQILAWEKLLVLR